MLLDAVTADAEQSVVALFVAGTVSGVEPAAVVPDGELERLRLDAAGNPDGRRIAVPDGVDGQFADDAQNRVCGRVGITYYSLKALVCGSGEGANSYAEAAVFADGTIAVTGWKAAVPYSVPRE